ncbi:hypothetical protein NUU61_001725 [Penicillium alfredii]|uniref:ATP-dependent DNA ligase family profile domain-containing protein n=1 Tax=Penicillium alfredii TaxID=1506179 RepID=A0A9W9FQ79_9EURO|nr:uncharacterized protein NUU61_001725 [Penicillium alfredii]KAJ5104378.1 hypothetical protein NUU61_001725 [Penicillium alfredii]
MGFNFSFLCDLLSSLEHNTIVKASTAAKTTDPDTRTFAQWFARHERHIHHADTDRLALLSCMFPEKRTDRVYWLQATSLARVIGRCLCLGSSRFSELDRWRTPGPDLGQCVEDIMRQAENHIPAGQEILVEDIDHALTMIASRCRFSGPRVRRQHTAVDVEETLAPLYRRLRSRDAKWLTRMILKSYSPVVLPQPYTLKQFHFLLPHLLQFQDSFEGALDMLVSEPMNHFPPHPDPKLAANLSAIALDYLRPRTGIKIGRPEYFKARSVKHCYQMAKGRRMSIERKYDGEYCQVHVDLSNRNTPIQIFSKSGKDSTADRLGIIPVVEESLQIRSPQCKFMRRCIVEGELLVWSDKHSKVADFHKLRKFLPRSGTFIGIENDSPPQPYEHLMIVLFDILLLDDDVCLKKPHRQRRLLLQDTVHPIPGQAAIAEQEILDFTLPNSQHRLEVSFARAIAQRWEGYVLKGCDEPYFPIYSPGVDNAFGRWIKLKKDYIPGLGDTVDLALIGASYDSQDATALSQVRKVLWTHYFVGCLLNKEQVVQFEATPRFRVVDVINRPCMNTRILQALNQFGEFNACGPETCGFNVEYGHERLSHATVLFKKPFVVEMLGSGFEKPSGARYFTLRFPRIVKVHTDRTFKDAASLRELQLLAENARDVPVEDLSQERAQWTKRLKVGNGVNHYIVRSQSPSSTCYSSEKSDLESSSSRASAASINDINDCDHHVLAENDNLTSHRCRQKESRIGSHNSEKARGPQPTKLPAKIGPSSLSSSMRATSLISMHQGHPLEPSKQESHAVSELATQRKSLCSPRPISIYTPKTSPGDENVSSLYEFLRSLESGTETIFQDTSLGIIIIDPQKTALGPEINKIGVVLASALDGNASFLHPKGKIFFLDTRLLGREIRAAHCQRSFLETWSIIGLEYFYACLIWNLVTPLNATSGPHRGSQTHIDMGHAGFDRQRPSGIRISFDKTDFTWLCEHTVIEPA